jgi:hypothetical protein
VKKIENAISSLFVDSIFKPTGYINTLKLMEIKGERKTETF